MCNYTMTVQQVNMEQYYYWYQCVTQHNFHFLSGCVVIIYWTPWMMGLRWLSLIHLAVAVTHYLTIFGTWMSK